LSSFSFQVWPVDVAPQQGHQMEFVNPISTNPLNDSEELKEEKVKEGETIVH